MSAESSSSSGDGDVHPPPSKRARRDYNDTLKVLVGGEGDSEEFTIHTASVCTRSSFFKAACSKEWIEARERIVRLPEADSEAFEVFVHWIYTEKLDFSTMTEPGNVNYSPSHLNLGKVWALAHYLGCTELRNLVIDEFLNKWARLDSHVHPSSLKRIWEMTPPGSTIRQLLLDYTVNRKRREEEPSGAEGFPAEIVSEAARRWMFISKEGARRLVPTLEDRCNYHEHGEGEPRSSYNETITVLVGPEEEKFIVHKSTACDNSPFFEAACSQHWVEGQEKVVRLPDTTPKLFAAFLHWAYSRELKLDDEPDGRGGNYPRTFDLGSLWGLANYLQTPALRNKVIDRLLQKFDAMPLSPVPRAALAHIWEVSPPESTIRRLLVDVHIARLSAEKFDQHRDEWPQELIMAAARHYFAIKKSPMTIKCPTFEERCKYHEHEHESGESCQVHVKREPA
ncbi:hypothetical protein PRZ48_013711 [Zasmidium cellare]|uniref:BTB domain-containing protein n=1 Tax=Zasmidium cellare TaxID=395010 RepID=A0ABR0E1V2_ZASCE|nr:hypothetical protein PRZ48_013711 [Zasmidium cellare]